MTIPGAEPTYRTNIIGSTAYTTAIGGAAPITMQMRCAVVFEIVRGTVEGWRYQGNACGGLPKRP